MEKDKKQSNIDWKFVIQIGTMVLSFVIFILNQSNKLDLLTLRMDYMNEKITEIKNTTDDLVPRVIKLESK
jgi:hypothetical protein